MLVDPSGCSPRHTLNGKHVTSAEDWRSPDLSTLLQISHGARDEHKRGRFALVVSLCRAVNQFRLSIKVVLNHFYPPARRRPGDPPGNVLVAISPAEVGRVVSESSSRSPDRLAMSFCFTCSVTKQLISVYSHADRSNSKRLLYTAGLH